MTSNPIKTNHSGRIRYLNPLLALLLALTLASAVAAIYRDRLNREAVAAAQISRLAEQMTARLDRFFSPVTEDLLLIRQWSLNGSLPAHEPEMMVAKLSPLMQNHPQIYAFNIWRHGHLAFMLVRDGEDLLMGAAKKTDPSVWVWQSNTPGGTVTEQWADSTTADGEVLRSWRKAPEALAAEQVVWHRTESLPPAGWIGLFAATGWNAENTRFVGAASVLDTQITQLLDDIRSGPSYRFFLFSENGLFIDFQKAASRSQDPLVTHDGAIPSTDSMLTAAGQAWREEGEEAGQPFAFTYAGDRLYGLTHTLKGAHQQTGIGVIAAKDDLLRHLPLNRFYFVPAVFGLLWVALLAVALRMGRLIKRVPGEKPLQAMTENELIRFIEQGETDTLEFKSTLRWNLKSGKAGKEIEMACLKTVAAFMNSDGGTLMVGVADDGTVVGTDPDNFPNDDKYLRHFSAIFEQHIGLNFSEFVEFALLPAKGEQVFVVRCQRAPRPVFVTHKKDEMFFIRSGPSSRQLTTSQVLAYLEERGRKTATASSVTH